MRFEIDFWTNMRRKLHNPEQGRVAEKVVDAVKKGQPDSNLLFRGAMAKAELKYIYELPQRDDTEVQIMSLVSAAQQRHLSEWTAGGGTAMVILGWESAFWHAWRWPFVPLSIHAGDLRGGYARFSMGACGGRMGDYQPLIDYIQDVAIQTLNQLSASRESVKSVRF